MVVMSGELADWLVAKGRRVWEVSFNMMWFESDRSLEMSLPLVSVKDECQAFE